MEVITEIVNVKQTKQIIDTQHDYMQLIYKFVIESDKENMCPIQQVRNEAIEFLKEQQSSQLSFTTSCFDNCFEDWIYTYVWDMTTETQNKFFNKYRLINILIKSSEFSKYNNVSSFNEYIEYSIESMEDYGFENLKVQQEVGQVYAINDLIMYIFKNDILKDILDDYKKIQ